VPSYPHCSALLVLEPCSQILLILDYLVVLCPAFGFILYIAPLLVLDYPSYSSQFTHYLDLGLLYLFGCIPLLPQFCCPHTLCLGCCHIHSWCLVPWITYLPLTRHTWFGYPLDYLVLLLRFPPSRLPSPFQFSYRFDLSLYYLPIQIYGQLDYLLPPPLTWFPLRPILTLHSSPSVTYTTYLVLGPICVFIPPPHLCTFHGVLPLYHTHSITGLFVLPGFTQPALDLPLPWFNLTTWFYTHIYTHTFVHLHTLPNLPGFPRPVTDPTDRGGEEVGGGGDTMGSTTCVLAIAHYLPFVSSP